MVRFYGFPPLLIQFFVFLVVVVPLSAQLPSPLYPKSSVRFLENKGQIHDTRGQSRPDILFTTGASGARLYFRPTGFSYVFSQVSATNSSTAQQRLPHEQKFLPDTNVDVNLYRTDVELVGANPSVKIYAEDETEELENYYSGASQASILGVRSFRRLIYSNVYPDIDMVLYGNQQGMKYDFLVRPGGNLSNIRLRYVGAESIRLSDDGSIDVVTPMGTIKEGTPATWQYGSDGKQKHVISSQFRLNGNELTFSIGHHDPTRILIIDPTLQWSTFCGGSDNELQYGGGGGGWGSGQGVEIDAQSNIIIIGSSISTNFPVSVGAYQSIRKGDYDAYLLKVNRAGTRIWSTYFGGTGTDWGAALSIDSSNNIFISGVTSSTNLPITPSAFQSTFAGGQHDAFLAKFDTNGVRIWCTYFGGIGQEWSGSIACDTAGNVILLGSTESTGLATTGTAQTSNAGNWDAFVAKFSGTGVRQWTTYFGGQGQENFNSGICIDAPGNIYFSGSTSSSDFPVSTGAFQTTFGGVFDAYLVKFNRNGGRVWSTLFGGQNQEFSGNIAISNDGNLYVAGYTTSKNFPVTPGAFQTIISTNTGTWDGYLVKFTIDGRRVWSTYFGGGGTDWLSGIAIDDWQNIIVSGYTTSTDFPITPNAMQTSLHGAQDAVLIKMDSSGRRVWASYFGGNDFEWGNGVVTEPNAFIMTGTTFSSDFPVTSGAFQSTYGGMSDAFISKFCDIAPIVTVEGPPVMCFGDSVILRVNGGFDAYRWSTGETSLSIKVVKAGKYWVTADLGECFGVSDTVRLTMYPNTKPTLLAHGPTEFCKGDTVILEVPVDMRSLYMSYEWSNGSNGPRTVARDSGKYYVTVTDFNGCRSNSDTILVRAHALSTATIQVIGSKNVCKGDSVRLEATPADATSKYLWSNGQTTQKIWAKQSGSYTVKVTNQFQCTGTSPAVVISVIDKPDAHITANPSATICETGSTQLIAPAGYTNYEWSTGESTPKITVRKPGTYTLRVVAAGGCSATSSIQVYSDPIPKKLITVLDPMPVCEGTNVRLVVNGSYRSFQWSTGERTPLITVHEPGTYWVRAENSGGCVGYDTMRVSVNLRPSSEIYGPVEVCKNGIGSYAVQDRAALVYEWAVIGGGGSIIGGLATSQIVVRWGGAGTGIVHVKVTDQYNGCNSESTINVSIGSSVKPAIISNKGSVLCPGDSIELDAGPNYSQYRWSTGDTTQRISITTSGAYSVTVSDPEGCGGSSDPFVVTVNQAPSPSIVAGGPTVFCPDDSVALDAGADYARYEWSNGARIRTIVVGQRGTYTVTVHDSNGCHGTSPPVVIEVIDVATPEIQGPDAACPYSEVVYRAPVAQDNAYNWSISPGGTILSGAETPEIRVQWSVPGYEWVRLRQSSATSGCEAVTPEYTVVVGPVLRAKISLSGPPHLCSGDSVTLSGAHGFESYEWSTGQTTRSIVANKAGTYRLFVTGNGNCTGSDSVVITLKNLPFPFIKPSGPISLCAGDSVMLEAVTGYAQYLWSTGDTTRQIVVQSSGNYSVVAVDENGCSGTSEIVRVDVHPMPEMPTISRSGDTLVSTPAAAYRWILNGTLVPGATEQRLVPTQLGFFAVTIVDSNGCSATSKPIKALEATAVVAIGDYEAAPGTRRKIPLELVNSHNLDLVAAYDFTARIRFNRYMIFPDSTTSMGFLDGDDRVITVTGRRAPGMEAGTLATMDVICALADTSVSPLVIESFEWNDVFFITKTMNGQMTVTPNGGWRVFNPLGRVALLPPRPNPAIGSTEVVFEVLEEGRTSLSLIDNIGRRVSVLFDRMVTSGRYSIRFNASQFSSGAYFLVLQTPNSRMLQSIQVEH